MTQIYDTGPMALLPFRRNHDQDFYALKKNSSTPAGFESANLGYSGEYDNRGTTGDESKHNRS